jgi:hypothetical protein
MNRPQATRFKSVLKYLLCWLAVAEVTCTSSAATGKKQPLTKTESRITLYVPCPCYHVMGKGDGLTQIDVQVDLAGREGSGARLALEISDALGKAIQTESISLSRSTMAGFTVHVPVESVARFGVSARLLDKAGREIANGASDIHVAPGEESHVAIGSDGFLRVAGKPQFVLGMYSASHFPEMGEAGFNATHSYAVVTGETKDLINSTDAHLKQLLDSSWGNHMRMMVELPRKAIEEADWHQVRRRILTFRHHPGLLCWGSEERVARGRTKVANIATLYRLVKELDPDHPLVLGDSKDVIKTFDHNRSDFFPEPYMDAGIWWWYPIPIQTSQTNTLEGEGTKTGFMEPPSWLTTTIAKKPLWIAIQSYQKPRADGRFPTPAEYRGMAYLSIINGVKGLFFYTGSGQKDHEGNPSGLLNKPEEGHWNYVKLLVGELHEFSPIIMAPSSAEKVEIFPANGPIEFATRESGNKMYLIAANKSPNPQSVRFSSPSLANKKALVLFEHRVTPIAGNVLADSFEPFGVHIYQIE